MYKATIFDKEEALLVAIKTLQDQVGTGKAFSYVIAFTQPDKEAPQWRIVNVHEPGFPLEGDFSLGSPRLNDAVDFIRRILPDGLSYKEALEMGIFPFAPANLVRWNPSNKET